MNIRDIFETFETAVTQGIYIQISNNMNYTGRVKTRYIK